MALGKRLINTGAAVAVCNTESVQAFGADSAFSSNVALYQLDGDGGVPNNVPDTTTNYDGTASNVTYATGQFGNAAVFNGSNSYIALGTNTPLNNFNGEQTISAWIYPTTAIQQSIIGYRDDSTLKWNYFRMNSDRTLSFLLRDSSSISSATTVGLINLNAWNHVCVTIDSSNINFYINGGTAEAFSNSVGSFTSSEPTDIGRRGSYSDQYFNGSIDQIRIYDAALTSDQVADLYNEKPEVDTSNFKAVLYEGTGATQYISNVGMDLETDGGLVWIKNRYSTQSHRFYDSVRGANLQISSNQTASEGNSGGLTSFDSNGFSLDNWASVNTNGNTYVSWVWKGGGDAVNIAVNSITASTPSIASDVSANTDAGFSIVKYTGDGGTATLGHGLSQQVEMVITKSTESTSQWMIYHKDLTGNTSGDNPYNLYFATNNELDLTAFGTYDSFTDSVFPVSRQSASTAHNNNLNIDYIAYCFHSVSGYSKIGSYEGNTTTLPSITLGFKPSFVMVKNVDGSDNWHRWYMFDDKRQSTNSRNLAANVNSTEPVNNDAKINFEANGFSIANSSNYLAINDNGDTYIYMAFK
jgi:hypothetical protein